MAATNSQTQTLFLLDRRQHSYLSVSVTMRTTGTYYDAT
jgi:hypothetical protein